MAYTTRKTDHGSIVNQNKQITTGFKFWLLAKGGKKVSSVGKMFHFDRGIPNTTSRTKKHMIAKVVVHFSKGESL
jgi:hypothetical protein